MSQSISLNAQNRYEIKVYGQLDDSWLGEVGWLDSATTWTWDRFDIHSVSLDMALPK